VSFATITLCVASQQVFIGVSIYFIMAQSRNFWMHQCTWEGWEMHKKYQSKDLDGKRLHWRPRNWWENMDFTETGWEDMD